MPRHQRLANLAAHLCAADDSAAADAGLKIGEAMRDTALVGAAAGYGAGAGIGELNKDDVKPTAYEGATSLPPPAALAALRCDTRGPLTALL